MDEVLLETERLRLRQFADTDADAARLFELDSDPEVMRYIGPFARGSVAEYRELIRVWLPFYEHPPGGVWAVEARATGDFFGWVFVRPAPFHRMASAIGWTRDTELELGYRFRRAAWGHGYATECAGPLVRAALANPAVTAVVAVALVTNRASTRVMEKVGLRYERQVELSGYADPGAVYVLPRAESGSARIQ
ncbi:GNAT family N-acetyltransferase [Gemmata sp. JC717]|uniref:GNAT family N-acetyltransferase n=1 Tax=Gemmata algarum TaxID=2975278 RepID=UPI0021BBB128|nr:GNAT family N-acetyltransferase [Gemmata algarum]MDY3555095.1 GNAT family N-acetyltransferase [Gemmata algarum]